jgi:hypothetical protein
MAVQSDTTSPPSLLPLHPKPLTSIVRELSLAYWVPPRLRFGFSSSTFSARGLSIHPVCWAALFSIAALRLTGRRP